MTVTRGACRALSDSLRKGDDRRFLIRVRTLIAQMEAKGRLPGLAPCAHAPSLAPECGRRAPPPPATALPVFPPRARGCAGPAGEGTWGTGCVRASAFVNPLPHEQCLLRAGRAAGVLVGKDVEEAAGGGRGHSLNCCVAPRGLPLALEGDGRVAGRRWVFPRAVRTAGQLDSQALTPGRGRGSAG